MARRPDKRKLREWTDRFNRFDESELTVKEFCEAEGVNEATWFWWQRRIRKAKDAVTLAKSAPVKQAAAISAPAQPVSTSGTIVFRLPNGTSVEVPACRPDLLASIMQAIGQLSSEGAATAVSESPAGR